jgi:nucleoside-diphosphate-sugar epimerase
LAEAEAGLAEPVIRHGQLEPRREFVDVRDMAAAYEAAGRLDHTGAEVFNVGGSVASIGEILEILTALARIPIRTELDQDRVRAGVPDALVLSSERFRSATGWQPVLPLEQSLSDTLDFWRKELASEHPAWPVRASS